MLVKQTLQINGFTQEIEISEPCLKEWLIPLYQHINQHHPKHRRMIVFLAGTPGSGKSVLGAVIEAWAKEYCQYSVQTVGLDGFHYPIAKLKKLTIMQDQQQVPLIRVKGCPESFNSVAFLNKLSQINESNQYWPVYDRRIHDVIENQILIEAEVIVIEGNWLLLDEAPWNQASYDCGILLSVPEEVERQRLIARKCKGGLSQTEAESFYLHSDYKNRLRVLQGSKKPDLRWNAMEL